MQDRNDDCNIAISWVPEGKRRREGPRQTWRRIEEKERKEARKRNSERAVKKSTNFLANAYAPN